MDKPKTQTPLTPPLNDPKQRYEGSDARTDRCVMSFDDHLIELAVAFNTFGIRLGCTTVYEALREYTYFFETERGIDPSSYTPRDRLREIERNVKARKAAEAAAAQDRQQQIMLETMDDTIKH